MAPPWEKKEIPVVPVVATGQEQEHEPVISVPHLEIHENESMLPEAKKKRASRIHLPHITLGTVPKPRRGPSVPRTPASPSPIEQWPGKM